MITLGGIPPGRESTSRGPIKTLPRDAAVSLGLKTRVPWGTQRRMYIFLSPVSCSGTHVL